MNALERKNIILLGLGKSGLAVLEELIKFKANVFGWDDCPSTRDKIKKIIPIINFKNSDMSSFDLLVLSPGISHNHPLVKKSKMAGLMVISEIDLLFLQNPNAFYIAISGTNGKSSIAHMVHHILKKNSINSVIGANFGIPAIKLHGYGSDIIYILEISSFSAESIKLASFDIVAISNIAKDHTDRYFDMSEYIKTKLSLIHKIRANSLPIIGLNHSYCNEIIDNINNRFIAITRLKSQQNTHKLIAKSIAIDINKHTIIDTKANKHILNNEIFKMEHNLENYAIALAICSELKLSLSNSAITKAISSYKVLPHRQELVTKKDKIQFINDSKATNLHSAIACIKNHKNIYWIAGGVEKTTNYSDILEYMPNIKNIFLIGKNHPKYLQSFLDDHNISYIWANKLENAIKLAYKNAVSSEKEAVVMLSPACASLDQFEEYTQRGNLFKEIAIKIANNSPIDTAASQKTLI